MKLLISSHVQLAPVTECQICQRGCRLKFNVFRQVGRLRSQPRLFYDNNISREQSISVEVFSFTFSYSSRRADTLAMKKHRSVVGNTPKHLSSDVLIRLELGEFGAVNRVLMEEVLRRRNSTITTDFYNLFE